MPDCDLFSMSCPAVTGLHDSHNPIKVGRLLPSHQRLSQIITGTADMEFMGDPSTTFPLMAV